MGNVGRKLLWGMVWSILAAALVATVSGCAGDGGHIAVHGVEGSVRDAFSYNIHNKGIWANGSVFEFNPVPNQTEFLDGLRRSYRVFDESDDRIQLIWNKQIYTVRRYADGHYALYGEMFWFKGKKHIYQPFPFPTDKMPGGTEDPPQPYLEKGMEFTTTADLPYLLRFYEVYGDRVKVEGNQITYAGCTITVEHGGLVKVAAPPPTTSTTLQWLSDAEVTKEVTAQLREKMKEEFGATVVLDTLDLRDTSVKGSEWDFEGVATAHLSREGTTITYDVRAGFVQGSGLMEWGWTAR
jgi:hypothetical protein